MINLESIIAFAERNPDSDIAEELYTIFNDEETYENFMTREEFLENQKNGELTTQKDLDRVASIRDTFNGKSGVDISKRDERGHFKKREDWVKANKAPLHTGATTNPEPANPAKRGPGSFGMLEPLPTPRIEKATQAVTRGAKTAVNKVNDVRVAGMHAGANVAKAGAAGVKSLTEKVKERLRSKKSKKSTDPLDSASLSEQYYY